MSKIQSQTSVFLATAMLLASLAAGLTPTVSADPDVSENSVAADTSAPPIVTGDIKAGIEKHIAEQVARGEGSFTLVFEGRELRLNLVRVHMEYLASLAPNRHFACVDMASDDGQFYDIDFFLAGDPGNMTVTETTVHKFNGQPNYAWEQKRDKTWHRIEVDDASPEVLGAIKGTDQFEFLYQATLPELTDAARMWIPIPTTDAFQTVEVKSITAPSEGLVARKMIEEGDMANPGMPLVSLESTGAMKVVAHLGEKDVSAVTLGDMVTVDVTSLDGAVFTAPLDKIIQAANPGSRTYDIEVVLDNPDPRLKSGMFARVSVPVGTREAVMVPTEAIINRGQLTGVWTVHADGTAHLRWVRLESTH